MQLCVWRETATAVGPRRSRTPRPARPRAGSFQSQGEKDQLSAILNLFPPSTNHFFIDSKNADAFDISLERLSPDTKDLKKKSALSGDSGAWFDFDARLVRGLRALILFVVFSRKYICCTSDSLPSAGRERDMLCTLCTGDSVPFLSARGWPNAPVAAEASTHVQLLVPSAYGSGARAPVQPFSRSASHSI